MYGALPGVTKYRYTVDVYYHVINFERGSRRIGDRPALLRLAIPELVPA